MKSALTVLFLLGSMTFLAAAPAVKTEPVAEGFPVWSGVSPKNHVMGREITASDLRHKVTVVVEVDVSSDKLQDQFLKAGDLFGLDPLNASGFGENWETRILPRDSIFAISVRGKSKEPLEAIRTAFKLSKDVDASVSRLMANVRSQSVPMYADLGLSEAANAEGKYPFVYVMGATGKEPVFKSILDAKGVKAAKAAFSKERKKLSAAEEKWVPFFGSVSEEKRPAALVKALEKGKNAKMVPLAPHAKAILKDVGSKDEEKARTAQIVYDALEQTRSDLVMRIKMEAGTCPHRALYDIKQLLKYWPGEKKRLEAVSARIGSNPEAGKLSQIFCKLMVWADPEFTPKNAGEAKKIVGELNKIKKDLGKLKESKVIVVQNGALLLDMKVDELIPTLQARVDAK